MFCSAIRRSADMRSSTASSASVQKMNLPSRRVATIPARRIRCRCCDALATERPVRSARTSRADCACASDLATAANWANSATGPRFCEALEIPLHRHHAATVKRCPHDPLNDWQRGRTSDHRKPAISCDRRRLQPHLFHGRTRRPQWYSPPLRDDARRAHASKDPPGLRCKSRIPGSCARRNEGAVSRLHFFGFLGRRPRKMKSSKLDTTVTRVQRAESLGRRIRASFRKRPRAAAGPEMKPALANAGGELMEIAPDRLAGFIKAEYDKWIKIIKDAAITLD